MKMIAALWNRFARREDGGVSVLMALTLPVLIAAGGIAIDYSVAANARNALQHAADVAATGSARELYLSDATATRVQDVAVAMAGGALANESFVKSAVTVAKVPDSKDMVTVTITAKGTAFFGDILGTGGEYALSATATARVAGGGRICMIGLDEKGKPLSLQESARLSAPSCAIYSNSTGRNGIHAQDNASITAELICSAGGVVGRNAAFSSEPVTDCPKVPDPLSNREEPKPGACKAKGLVVLKGAWRMEPGTYCGGVHIGGTAEIVMEPGIYIFQDGPLVVDGTAKLKGEYVGLFFTGKLGTMLFDTNSEIDLGAPKDGPMAGILIWESQNSLENRQFQIFSNNARNLLGTIYLPKGRLYIDADAPIADQSAYTVVVAHRFELYSGPNMFLNANYGATDVPVPAGVGAVGGNIVLTR